MKEQANKSLFFIAANAKRNLSQRKIAEQMMVLSRRLMNTGGKEVYGYVTVEKIGNYMLSIISSLIHSSVKDSDN